MVICISGNKNMAEEIKRATNSQTPSHSSSSSSSSSLSTSSYFFMPRPLIDSVMKHQQQQQPLPQRTKSSMRTCNLRNESLWRESRQNPFLSIILTNNTTTTTNTTTGVNNHVNWLTVQQPGGFLGNNHLNFMKSN